MTRTARLTVATLLVGYTSSTLWADEPRVRHGVISVQKPGIEVQAGATMTLQSSNDDSLEDEGLLSVDLTAMVPIGQGQLLTYVEGNTSPRQGGISSRVGEVNADAGSALDDQDRGRFQVSEIHYTQRIGANILTVGMLDPDCRLDNSSVANDETEQFLASAFVNNPTIAFPDYTLGGCLHVHDWLAPYGLNILVTSSHGLADNPDKSYSELFDVTADGKGVFAGVELYRQTASGIWRLGLWRSTADTDYVDGSGSTGENYGAYLNADYIRDTYALNLRLGVANEDVSDAASFASLAFEKQYENATLGIAAAYTGVSDDAGGTKKDISQSEIYYRFNASEMTSLTPSVQWVKNSGFGADSTIRSDLVVYSLRFSLLFQ